MNILRLTLNTFALVILALSVSAETAKLDPVAERLTWNEIQTETKQQGALDAAFSPQVSQFHSGDTAYYLCAEKSFQFGTGAGTDCWGYRAPNGTEYAIFGIYNGVAVVNTSTMAVVGTVIGPENGCGGAVAGPRWRDMKSYRRYVYITSECTGTNQGVMILNMTNLPTSFSYVGSVIVTPSWGNYTSHNLSIDTMKGYMYLEGIEANGVTLSIYNLSNQANPTFVTSMGINYGDNGIHDIFVQNDTMFLAEGWNSTFSIWNMANKTSPQLIARVPIPAGGYVHNIWPREDLKYAATTEETANKTIKIWDLHNLANIELVGEYLAPNRLAHNTHWKGDKLYTSHYESGITVVDVSDPTNPQQIYQHDTWPTEDPDFNGCWGAYPFTGNGFVYASNMDGKMYVFSEHLDVLSDTMWAETTFVAAGTQAIVDIYAKNSLPLRQFTIPLNWTGPYGMSLVGTSRTGTRTEYFQSESFLGIDIGNNRVAIALKTSTNETAPDLPPGTGKILSVTFDVPGAASGQINPVSFTPYIFGGGSHNPAFVTECIAYEPDTIPGAVKLNSGSCCIGSRGNVNGSVSESPTIADLTYLVQYLFNGGNPSPCADEGNVNGLGGITVADLTFLVQFLFNSGAPPPACP